MIDRESKRGRGREIIAHSGTCVSEPSFGFRLAAVVKNGAVSGLIGVQFGAHKPMLAGLANVTQFVRAGVVSLRLVGCSPITLDGHVAFQMGVYLRLLQALQSSGREGNAQHHVRGQCLGKRGYREYGEIVADVGGDVELCRVVDTHAVGSCGTIVSAVSSLASSVHSERGCLLRTPIPSET